MTTTTAIEQLYQIMEDQAVPTRDRINAAVSASRVEPLHGDTPPPAVAFLRHVMTWQRKPGIKSFSPQHRRLAGAALAYWERRAAKAAITFAVPNTAERSDEWVRLLNALLREYLWDAGRWPHDAHLLLAPGNYPQTNPELALAAILIPDHQWKISSSRKKALDQPDQLHIAGPQHQQEIFREIAHAMQQRLEAPLNLDA